MTDPKRLIDDFGPGFKRELLRLAGNEKAPARVQQRVEARVLEASAVAVASSVSGAAGGAAAGKSASALGVVVMQWLAVGAVAGGATALTGSAIADRVMQPPRSVPVTHMAAPAAVRTASPRSAEPPSPAERRAPAVQRSRTAKVEYGEVHIGASSALSEAEAMRRIRVEAKLDPGRALTLVDRYLVRFPDGAHLAEAKALERRLMRKLSEPAR